jgi:hypothetical protein
MSLALKAALGALMVVVIAALSRTPSFYVAGLVPLFPTLSLPRTRGHLRYVGEWVHGTTEAAHVQR